jgi:acetyl esterase/lipase
MKETCSYKTAGALEIKADVYRCPGDKLRPAVLYIHGGALIGGSRGDLPEAERQLYLAAGFNVVAIDYRLAPETKLAAIVEDIEDSYAWVRANGPGLLNIDPDRIAIMGKSAGGYLTMTAGFRVGPRPKALISYYGYGDLTGAWYARPDPFYCRKPPVSVVQAYKDVTGRILAEAPIGGGASQGRYQFYLYCRQQGLWPKEISGHDPETEAAWFAQYEPLRNVTPDYPPTLLLHGEPDTDVPFEQSVLMAAALERHGVDHEFVRRSDRGHAFDLGTAPGDAAMEAAYGRILAFLKQHVL